MSNGGTRNDRMRDVSHLHNDTSSSVNSTGWTGCQAAAVDKPSSVQCI